MSTVDTAAPLVKRSRCTSPMQEKHKPLQSSSPRRQRIEVREQEKASIVNCTAIQSSSGFRDLSLCDKATFDECQDGKVPVTNTPPTPDVCPRLDVCARHDSGQDHVKNGTVRRLSREGESSSGSLGSGVSYKEIKGYNAVTGHVKNLMRPPSSRGGQSPSLLMRRPPSFPDMLARDQTNAKSQADLMHSRLQLDAYAKHTAALEHVCREAGLSVPMLRLPLPPSPALERALSGAKLRSTSSMQGRASSIGGRTSLQSSLSGSMFDRPPSDASVYSVDVARETPPGVSGAFEAHRSLVACPAPQRAASILCAAKRGREVQL